MRPPPSNNARAVTILVPCTDVLLPTSEKLMNNALAKINMQRS